MSTTTQILFNSPALHSLKREQLVKLCKIHSLKANGKNVELIQRLRQHAESLPKDSPLSVAARSEFDDPILCKPMETDELDQHAMQVDVQPTVYMPRPSEQWEVVMDSIEEVEENSSQGSLSSQHTVNNTASGEFGTGGSATSTVTSSIRALATSLGLRKTTTKLPSNSTSSKPTTDYCVSNHDDLARNSKPYSMIPVATSLPQTDHFTLDTGRPSFGGDESPLPGHTLRPGIPVPPNARLSMGLGIGVPATPTRKAQPTTTIRLVSNPLAQQECVNDPCDDERESGTPQLKPFQTTFDITFGSPVSGGALNFGFPGLTSWPPKRTDDAEMTMIRSSLTSDVITPSKVLAQARSGGTDEEGEGHVKASPSSPRLSVPHSTPFIFGSPHHRVSNTQFREAASSVLEEMNARLRAEGVEEIGVDIINKLHPSRDSLAAQREIKPIPTLKRGEITSKFDEVHQREFSKMEGIDTFKRRQPQSQKVQPEVKKKDDEKDNVVVGRKRKSSAIEQDPRPMSPSVANKARMSTTRVISNGRRPKVVPGGFGLDDEDEEALDDLRAGKRVRVDSDSLKTTEESKIKEEREIQLEKEKEVIKKKLEANRARRRSSAAARRSLGRNGPRPSVLIKPKPKPSRFGFLASAKSLVQNVWSRGKSSNPPSNIPKLTAAPAQAVHGQGSLTKDEKGKTKMAPPPFVPNRKAALAPAKPTTLVASGNKTMALSTKPNNLASECPPASQFKSSLASTRSPRSRSPLPDISTFSSNSSFGIASRRAKDTRTSSILGTSKSRTSAGVSSIGTRSSGLRTSGLDTISSMGTKKTSGGGSRNSSLGTAVSSSSSTRTAPRASSRLLAPTASSLAKTINLPSIPMSAGTPSSSVGDVGRLKTEMRSEKVALGSITNSQASNKAEYPSSSHHNQRIFTEPLLLPTLSNDPGERGEEFSSNAALPKTNVMLKRTLSGRKPRISRSKVIAKLASQRAASGSSISSSRSSGSGTSVLKPRVGAADSSGRTRSSLGIKVARASYGSGGGFKSRPSGGRALPVSAKRSARQSEYSRRRSSRVAEGHREQPVEQNSAATGSNV